MQIAKNLSSLAARVSSIEPVLKCFFFRPASPRPLALLRMGVSATLLLQAWMVRATYFDMFSSQGIIQGPITRYLSGPYHFDVTSLLPFGFDERRLLAILGLTYALSLFCLLIGAWSRGAAIVAWLLHMTLMKSGVSTNYGADAYGHIFLFYFMFFPISDTWSVDSWKKGSEREVSSAARFAIRVIQLHLCISYFSSAVLKAAGPQWWDGEVIWRAMTLPVYIRWDMTWLSNHMWICKLSAWGTLVLEGLYPIFIWPKVTRPFWVAGIVSLHLGIAIFMGLEIFGLLLAFLTLAVFGISSEPNSKTIRL